MRYQMRNPDGTVILVGTTGGGLLEAYADAITLEPIQPLAVLTPDLGKAQVVASGEHKLDVMAKMSVASQLGKSFAWGEHPGRVMVSEDAVPGPAGVTVASIDRALAKTFGVATMPTLDASWVDGALAAFGKLMVAVGEEN